MARLSLRIDLGPAGALGPGRVRLLEQIDMLGSISAAARSMRMSYRRAWLHVDSMNRCFRRPVVDAKLGGKHGGGACLTPLGGEIIRHYRAMESEAYIALATHLAALQAATATMESAKRRRARPVGDG
jgi:molybdate transport system regulatory protein